MTAYEQGAERLVQLTVDLRREIESLTSSYNRLADTIDREHDAVRAADLKQLSPVVQEKVMLVDAIEGHVGKIKKVAEQALLLKSTAEGDKAAEDMAIQEVVALVSDLSFACAPKGLAADVLQRQLKFCRSAMDELLKRHAEIKPKIEINKRVVASMQEHHRASHRFWQSVLSDAEATYTGSGAKKGEANTSVIRIQA